MNEYSVNRGGQLPEEKSQEKMKVFSLALTVNETEVGIKDLKIEIKLPDYFTSQQIKDAFFVEITDRVKNDASFLFQNDKRFLVEEDKKAYENAFLSQFKPEEFHIKFTDRELDDDLLEGWKYVHHIALISEINLSVPESELTYPEKNYFLADQKNKGILFDQLPEQIRRRYVRDNHSPEEFEFFKTHNKINFFRNSWNYLEENEKRARLNSLAQTGLLRIAADIEKIQTKTWDVEKKELVFKIKGYLNDSNLSIENKFKNVFSDIRSEVLGRNLSHPGTYYKGLKSFFNIELGIENISKCTKEDFDRIVEVYISKNELVSLDRIIERNQVRQEFGDDFVILNFNN